MIDQLIYFYSVILGDVVAQLTWLLAGFVALTFIMKVIERGWLIEAKETIETRLKQESTNEVTLIDIGE
jgi:hypothetical protein